MRLNRSSWVFIIVIAWLILMALTEYSESKNEKRVTNGRSRTN